MMYIKLVEGRKGWFWHIKGKNGQIILTSQRYFSKSNAKRAAKRLAKANTLEII